MGPIDAVGRWRCELRGCVTLAAEDVEGDVGLIADHPAVVSGRDVEEVASPHHHFASVVHLGHRLTAQYEADMLNLARRLTSHRPDVLRPLPTRLVCRAAERGGPDLVELELALSNVRTLLG